MKNQKRAQTSSTLLNILFWLVSFLVLIGVVATFLGHGGTLGERLSSIFVQG